MQDVDYNKGGQSNIQTSGQEMAGGCYGVEALAADASRIVASTLSQVYIRRVDGLLILRPNRMYFMNNTAMNILEKLYSPDYHVKDVNGNVQAVELSRIIDECARKYKTGNDVILADIGKLVQTLESLLRSQNSIPYVDSCPTPALKMTGFGSHEIYYPVLSEIAMTYRCQLRCKFCYAGAGSGKCRDFGAEMDIAAIKLVISKIYNDAHCPTISFTGGEPTLRFDELLEAVAYAKSLGMRTNLITNGLVLSENSKVLALGAAGLDSAQVSVEGGDSGAHDHITGMPGSFEKSMAAVKNLKDARIHVHTNSTMTAENVESIYKLPEILAGLGLKYFSANMVIKTGTANINRSISIDYSNIGRYVKNLNKIAEDKGIKLVWYSPTPYCLFNPVEEGLGSKSCAAASGLLSVSPSGEVLPCSSFKDGIGNILNQSFSEIWDSRAARYFRNKEFVPPACKKCEKADICQSACPLYWDACRDYSEIERACGRERSGVKNFMHRLKRRITAPNYGI